MAARYRRIAEDLTRRIAAGEWTIGTTLPPIAQLQEQYDGCALNTIRAAQQVLVDDGILETISGRGAYVTRKPGLDASKEEVKRQLEIVHAAAGDALRALALTQGSTPSRPGHAAEAVGDSDDDALTKTWGYMRATRCNTCDEELGVISRGWVEIEDEVDLYLPIGHDGHDLVTYFGINPNDDQELALRREHWWERLAHLEVSAELLLEGDYGAAGAHAGRARDLLNEDPALNNFGVQLVAFT